MRRKSRRHKVGFGYIGFGNNHNVFNQTTYKAFSALKDKLNEESHLHHQLSFLDHKLTKKERKTIKDRIRKQKRKRLNKAIIIFIIVSIPISYFVYLALNDFASRL